jgi:hypothetical protein
MPARWAQQNDENSSPPTEGMAVGQGWVASRKSFPYMEPTPSAAGVHPSVGGDFLRNGLPN